MGNGSGDKWIEVARAIDGIRDIAFERIPDVQKLVLHREMSNRPLLYKRTLKYCEHRQPIMTT